MDWKRHSYKWSVLVVFMDESLEGSPVLWKWFPIEKVRPVYPDPNPRQDEWF